MTNSSESGTVMGATKRRRVAVLAIPLVVTAAIVLFFLQLGPAGIFPGSFPPVEELSFGRVTLTPNQINVVVTNGGPSPVTISQILVDDAYWNFTSDTQGPIDRLNSAKLTIPYPWVPGEPVKIAVVTSTGLTFEHTIDVASTTPAVDGRFLVTFGLIGLYIGFVPVLAGMTWKPFLSTLSPRWINFFLAFTAGVLIFLGVDTVADALQESAALPSSLGGIGLVVVAGASAYAVTGLAAGSFSRRAGTDRGIVTAFAVAAGIGVHNFGEGLAVGAAYRLGEIALGTFLIIGFAIHNTTEGLGIVSILGNRRASLALLAALGVVAGLPTVLGAWTGAFFFSPMLATIFLGVAAGAIAHVVVEVMRVVRKTTDTGLSSPESMSGITIGVAMMYATGLLVAA